MSSKAAHYAVRSQRPRDVVRTDAIIVGGGPAGCTAAALLSSWGRSVVLIHRDTAQPSLAESLPWSTRKLLRHLGQLDAVDAAGFHPNSGNISRWAGQHAIAATEGPGFHVSRADFDRVLRGHARSKGAEIVEGSVGRVDISRLARVECDSAGGVTTYECDFVLDCSGRAGVIARRGLRRADAGYRTLAIASEWECPEWPAEERTHTFVDSYDNGWAWSVPLSPTRRQCTVMVDAGLTTVSKAGLGALYRSELHKAVSIEHRLKGSRQISVPWGCDASLYTCDRATDSRALLVGDAASFIEPLSSAGVRKALASAWRAAIAVNTVLSKPEMLDVALAFHDRRERWLYEQCVRASAVFFARAAEEYDHPFWSTRASYVPDGFERPSEAPSDDEIAHDRDVQRIASKLREAVALRWTTSPQLVVSGAPVVEGNQIVVREGVALDGFDEPLRFACGVDLLELARIASRSADMSAVIQEYFARVGPVDPRSLLQALAFLIRHGAVQGDPGGTRHA
jgi:flavin-dependent dehydrogenase